MELAPSIYVKIDDKNRYKNVNRGLISWECSHGSIQYFPLIARVHTQANVNKMVTEKKDRGHTGHSWVREKPKHRLVGTQITGDGT